MSKRDQLMRRVRSFYPKLVVTSAELITTGQYNDVLLVNGALVFRFPRYTEAIERLETAVRVLDSIDTSLPVRVPRALYRQLTGCIGEIHVGYRWIPGIALSRVETCQLGDSRVEGLAVDVAEFLHELHGLPPSLLGADPSGSMAHTHPDNWTRLFQAVEAELFELMSAEGRRKATAHFEPLLRNPEWLKHQPRVVHGDFGASNILVDRGIARVTGVIDFDSVQLGDPAVDIASLLASMGTAFVRQLSRYYAVSASCWERAQFYRGTFALQEALFGLQNGDQGALDRGLACYR